jgi:hypothetical protein
MAWLFLNSTWEVVAYPPCQFRDPDSVALATNLANPNMARLQREFREVGAANPSLKVAHGAPQETI